MATLTITLDERTEADLRRLSDAAGSASPSEYAARLRLLARAVRAARPRPVYDIEAIRANCTEFAAEDEALAESDIAHPAELLAACSIGP
jgi:hypothetical protein